MRDATALSEGRTHPHDVVVAPLDVHIMLRLQRLHDNVGLRASIVDVADDVQLADGQALDELRERLDERDAAPGAHRRIKDAGIVRFLVHAVIVLVHQLLDDVGELGGQRLAHAACRVLARRALAHRHQARHHGGVPGALVFHTRQDQLRLLTRVVDERGQLALLGLGQLIAKRLVHLQTDGTRPVAQDVAERLGFAVDVGAEELRALREVQDGAQVDDLGRRQLLRGERSGQQFQVALLIRFHENLLRSSHSDGTMVPRAALPRAPAPANGTTRTQARQAAKQAEGWRAAGTQRGWVGVGPGKCPTRRRVTVFPTPPSPISRR